MKKSICLVLCCFLTLTFINRNVVGQTLEAEKSHALSKDAKKGYLGSFKYDDVSKQYTLVFQRDKGKETIYETMKFDYDFNQIDQSSESLSLVDASKKFDFVDYDEEKWTPPTVVRIDAKAFGMGNITLKKGTVEREWVKPTSFESGNYLISYSGYWKYNFKETQKIVPKIEVPVEIDPRAPAMIIKAAENQAKKIYLIAYMTDEPGIDIQTGRRYYNPRKLTSAYYSPKKRFSSASGDIVVVGKQYYAVSKTYFNQYVALKYSAADFSEKARTTIDFKYGTDTIYKQVLPDQTIALFFAPLPGAYVKPGEPNPNPRAFTFIRVDKEAKVIDRIEFESPSSKWEINNIEITPEGDLIVYGEASQKSNDKYYMQQVGVTKFDNFQLMKISGGKVAFITSTSIEEFAGKLQIPANMKKVDSYDGRKFDIGSITTCSTGDLLISGQENNGGTFGNISLFQFGSDGKLKAQYGYKLEETGKEAQSMQTIHVEFENPDNKTITWIVYELTGSTNEKMLIYPRVATIDLGASTISAFSQYGYTKDQEFFVDNSRPVILIDDNRKAVFFGSDKNNKTIWFARIKLGE